MAKQNAVPTYTDQEESAQVRKDLIRVIVLNAILFAILIGLYFWDQSSGQVDRFFEKFLNF